MDLLPTSEQQEIISSARSFLASNVPITRTRELIDERSNVDERVWAAAADLGWFALGLPESRGGVGAGLADEALLFREIGRSLASGPFLATVLGARVASFGGDPELSAAIAAGAKVGLALPDRDESRVRLLDTVGAEWVLLAEPQRASLFRAADIGEPATVPCLDPGSRLSRVEMRGVTAELTVDADVDPVERRGHVLVAAMLTGIAEATRDIGAEHAKVRVQFGRPIGVNQAVKHPCAEMAVRSELAAAQTVLAAAAFDEDREDAELQALTANVVAGHAAERNAAATIQILGAMGFTFEHDANLFMKRAYVLGHAFGEERAVLDRLLQLPAAV
jgi:alkylation response protein AidB-like acyl-CoA dehydrogenase